MDFSFDITGEVNENNTPSKYIKNISDFSNITVGMQIINSDLLDDGTEIIEVNECLNYLKLNKDTIGDCSPIQQTGTFTIKSTNSK